MELHALHKIVLGCFDNLQTATLQGIAERDRRRFPADDCHGLGFLRLVAVDGLLRDGVSAGE